MMVNWSSIIFVAIILTIFREGKAIKCYECYYASGDVPYIEYYEDKRENCLNTKIVDCGSGTTSCQNGTLFYTKQQTFRFDAQYCGDQDSDKELRPCQPFQDRDATSAIKCRCGKKDLCNFVPKNETLSSTTASNNQSTQQPALCPCAATNQSANATAMVSSCSEPCTGWVAPVLWILLVRVLENGYSPTNTPYPLVGDTVRH